MQLNLPHWASAALWYLPAGSQYVPLLSDQTDNSELALFSLLLSTHTLVDTSCAATKLTFLALANSAGSILATPD